MFSPPVADNVERLTKSGGDDTLNPRCDPQSLANRRSLFLIALFLGSVLFVVLLTGKTHFRHRHNNGDNAELSPEEVRAALFASFDSDRMSQHLEAFTREVHIAGTPQNGRVAEKIAEIWKQNGLQDVHFVPYDVLLSYPNFTSPNHLFVLSADGQTLFRTKGLSPELLSDPGAEDYRNAIQWLAYSAEGTVEGEPVYCHYGRPQDFDRLEREFNISLEGKIAVLRYNVEFRGDKVRHAQDRGAIGAILYTDPAEAARDGIESDHTFPHTAWMPWGGVQRGSLMYVNGDPLTPLLPARKDFFRQKSVGKVQNKQNLSRNSIFWSAQRNHTFPSAVWMPSVGVQRGTLKQMNGDLLTPLLPARKDFYRGRSLQKAVRDKALPSIPVLPIGYGDAAQILSRMAGPEVPTEWQGKCGNFTYHIGPTIQKDKGHKLKLEVQSKMEIKTVQNVIGYIYGAELPDEWVMLGNHFDAWVYGAIDPNSGSAILAEVTRAFGETAKAKGWKPRRTLVFCAWDGEEHGLIGSTEFVEEFADVLRDRAVVYLNVDLISSNQSLDVRTVPTLYTAVTEAAKLVPNPMESERAKGRRTMFDSWLHYFPAQTDWLPDTPKMAIPGGGSDHASFLNFLGIPVVDFTYRNASWLTYPLYHSRYELPFVNEHLFDHNQMTVHKAVGQYWAELARSFADSELLPINATIFAHKMLAEYVADVKESIHALHARYPDATAPALQQLSALLQNVRAFLEQSEKFERAVASPNRIVSAEWSNRRLRRLDQCFINPALGLAQMEPEKRHVLFSLSRDDSYQATVMAAVQAKIAQLGKAKSKEKRMELGKELALELTVIQQATLCAVNTLKAFV